MAKIGIDIVENKRINLEEKFLKKFLHQDEILLLNDLQSSEAKLQFASGRWAAKEALIKCLEVPLEVNKINIVYRNSKPVIENSKFKNIELSISHEKNYSVAVALNL
ncbi:holo-ACP synthase [Spiroplasma cantharicola]|uniref:Holo-[acyl-carrier-protein] synthase n=1 Tax=Spiroplasma cantharicola TaxID=362837 RepID=A0A0M4JK31_9MOLU|nr:4'-phosphopantetheinyl transferase superfamily protein [Spiroplasma cantharicola]ALD66661.1 holo-[acyl-carrier-protein] synthase [Spiroplasma cantharicola]